MRVAPESTCHTVALPFTIMGMYAPKVAPSFRESWRVWRVTDFRVTFDARVGCRIVEEILVAVVSDAWRP